MNRLNVYALMPLLIFITLAVVLSVALIARPKPITQQFYHQTVDGVDCVVFNAYGKGGISCNWERYNKEHP